MAAGEEPYGISFQKTIRLGEPCLTTVKDCRVILA
jgi:hypothetical protein